MLFYVPQLDELVQTDHMTAHEHFGTGKVTYTCYNISMRSSRDAIYYNNLKNYKAYHVRMVFNED